MSVKPIDQYPAAAHAEIKALRDLEQRTTITMRLRDLTAMLPFWAKRKSP